QEEAVEAILSNHDTFVILRTGGGKSLCYQLAALATAGITIVISPLKDLIEDQYTSMVRADLTLLHRLYGNSPDNRETHARLLAGDCPLLYITLESFFARFADMSDLYERNAIARFVVDETHYILETNADFREQYGTLESLRKNFPGVPFCCFTATITPRDMEGLIRRFHIEKCTIVRGDLDRPNLRYAVLWCRDSRKNQVRDLLNSSRRKGTKGLIYCRRKKHCTELAKFLREQGHNAQEYFRGKPNESQKIEQMLGWGLITLAVCFVSLEVHIELTATPIIARFVIHYDHPKSMMNYIQEAGRAGRDGRLADAILCG
ncbi:P-loop containing nucleoside triphosphate hydrolase protein, partial [Clavulina sp. PMI_390]